MARGRLRTLRGAREALRRRADARAAEAAAASLGVDARIVGGAVRDAFLGRTGGDLDLAVHTGDAAALADALARDLGTRAIPIGRPGTRVIRVPEARGEVDVWEIAGSIDADRDRRDFTVNALSFSIPGWLFDAPDQALDDLARGLLRPPRAGVLLEDPLRVLRAARFAAELPGFRVAREALPELRRAARLLPGTAAERRLAEWDRIFAADRARAACVLLALERWGALAPLMPGATASERREGIRRVRRLPARTGAPAARAAFLAPLGAARAAGLLEGWKTSKIERRMAGRVLALAGARFPASPSRRDLVRAVRGVFPFVREAGAVLATSPFLGTRRFGIRLGRLPRAAVERIANPRRPVAAPEVADLLGIGEGPALGRALALLDEAVAAGLVRSAAGARRFLLRGR